MGLTSKIGQMLGRSKTVVGLDVGSSSVKAVELARTSSGLEMVRYGITEVVSSGGKSKEDDPEALMAAMRQVFQDSGISANQVCTAVSGESVIVRPIPMPRFEAKREEEFEIAVRGEARDFIPFEMDDVVFDYQRLAGRAAAAEKGAKTSEVLIVAVKKDLIDRHLTLLEAIGLEPTIIDVDSIALVNAVIAGSEINPEEAVAVVNIGSNVTNIAIMRDEMTRFTRDLAIGGRNITAAIASQFDISPAEAEAKKRALGMSAVSSAGAESESAPEAPAPGVIQDLYQAIEDLKEAAPEAAPEQAGDAEARQIGELCEQVIGDIVSEVKRSLLYYENQLDGEPIARVLLSGGSAQLKGIREYFESVLDVPAELIHPFRKIRAPFSQHEAEEKGPLLGVCLGLALRNVI